MTNYLCKLTKYYQNAVDKLKLADGLAPLFLRLYLAPVMLQAGWNKYQNFDSIVSWFGDAEWGLGLPLPSLMAFLATAAELVGGILLILGLLTRLVAIPLMSTMLVAITTVHWQHGWLADGTILLDESIMRSADKLARANDILTQHGHIDWLTSSGKFVILNNGIEFAATYFVMLLVLLFSGGGRYTSLDDWIKRKLSNN